jgi:hypothetical protein
MYFRHKSLKTRNIHCWTVISARKGIRGLPSPVKLELNDMTYTVSVWRKTQLNKRKIITACICMYFSINGLLTLRDQNLLSTVSSSLLFSQSLMTGHLQDLRTKITLNIVQNNVKYTTFKNMLEQILAKWKEAFFVKFSLYFFILILLDSGASQRSVIC